MKKLVIWSQNNNIPYSIGYVYEVDLEYPELLRDPISGELHSLKQKTRFYPFCPEKKEIPYEWLSDWQKEHYQKQKGKKLILTQCDKKNYIIEGRMLDWYLDNGMILTKIHKKLVYQKSKWLKDYIEFNLMKRTESKSIKDKFGDFFYKLMNNAFYGKTLENVRNRQDVEIVNSEDRFKWLVAKPTIKRWTTFNTGDVIAVHKNKTKTYFNKFNYIGFTILELSKLTMYKFIYDVLYTTYKDKMKIHYTDTDSITFELIDENIDKVSPYLHDSELGKFKDEIGNNNYIFSSAFIRPKVYIQDIREKKNLDNPFIKKKIKGISKASCQKLSSKEFEDCITKDINYHVTNYSIISKKHNINFEQSNKLALNNYYDKGYVLRDGIETVPYGFQGVTDDGYYFDLSKHNLYN